jgi:deazaflavin-dependent oxidoreductase (nitroreductase family)
VIVLGPLSRRINPLILRLAGRRHSGPVAKLHHRGRRTGRAYVAPVLARPDDDGFLVPLFFGAGADWCRNVLAAQGCRIDSRGRTHPLHRPRVVPAGSIRGRVLATFPAHERIVLRLSGINEFLVLDTVS